MRKTLCFLTLFSCVIYSASLHAQLRIAAPDPFSADLKKIISAFPDHFRHYRGDLISENVQSTEYGCTLKVSGAEEMTITTYSGKKEIWSWQGLMYSTENFEKARQKFRHFYSLLNGLTLNGFKLEGTYEAPAEEKKFTSIVFEPRSASGGWERLRVELLMEFGAPMEWRVKVTVYDQEKKDEEESGVY